MKLFLKILISFITAFVIISVVYALGMNIPEDTGKGVILLEILSGWTIGRMAGSFGCWVIDKFGEK